MGTRRRSGFSGRDAGGNRTNGVRTHGERHRPLRQVPAKVAETTGLPVDHVAIGHERGNLEFNGVDTVMLNRSVIGDPRCRPGIACNRRNHFNAHSSRRRFTRAHALCHLLFDRHPGQRLAVASGLWAPCCLISSSHTSRPERAHRAASARLSDLHRQPAPVAEDAKSWRIYHDGRMSQVPVTVVMEAVREAQAGRRIDSCSGGKERLCLGVLPDAGSADWSNSRDSWRT